MTWGSTVAGVLALSLLAPVSARAFTPQQRPTRDRLEDRRDRLEDRRDRREDRRDLREDRRDLREDRIDRRRDGGIRDRLEDRRDRREDFAIAAKTDGIGGKICVIGARIEEMIADKNK